MLFCIVTFNLWLHYNNKLLNYLFQKFAATYYHFFYWNWYQLIFAVSQVSFWALTPVLKLCGSFLH